MRRFLVLLLALGTAAGAARPPSPADQAASQSRAARSALIERGAYLALVGNCAGCHTAPGGRPYAGGRSIETPFGRVQVGNLTPHATGLGGWRADDLWNALHHGRGHDGRRLLPAFPYTSYTHLTRDDSDALFAFLQSLAPVAQANRPHELRGVYGSQAALGLWQLLFFRPADEAQSAALKRANPGAYLVKGPGHCAACHAPRNAWGAPANALRGGLMDLGSGGRWWAPSLHPQQGRPAPAEADAMALLRDGVARHASAVGPMAKVVRDSLQHWREDDLRAAVRYLQALSPEAPTVRTTDAPAPALLRRGRERYAQLCADCHGLRGEGQPGAFPPLAGNPTVLQPQIHTLVQVVRRGAFAPSTRGNPHPHSMPALEGSDDDLAAVLTHIRTQWGNRAEAVSALDVLKAR